MAGEIHIPLGKKYAGNWPVTVKGLRTQPRQAAASVRKKRNTKKREAADQIEARRLKITVEDLRHQRYKEAFPNGRTRLVISSGSGPAYTPPPARPAYTPPRPSNMFSLSGR